MDQANQQLAAQRTKETIRRIILRSYFVALFTSCMVAFLFSHQLSALMVFLLAFSLVLYLCCNCGNCNYQMPFIAGQVLVAPPVITAPMNPGGGLHLAHGHGLGSGNYRQASHHQHHQHHHRLPPNHLHAPPQQRHSQQSRSQDVPFFVVPMPPEQQTRSTTQQQEQQNGGGTVSVVGPPPMYHQPPPSYEESQRQYK